MTNLSRALAYLEKLPPAISGSGGHNATIRAACACAKLGLTESEMIEAMNWYNANRCSPPWREAELQHKIDDARKLAGGSAARPQSFGGKTRTFTPPAVTAKRKARPVIAQGYEAEERWWANVAQGLGMTLAEFDRFCGN